MIQLRQQRRLNFSSLIQDKPRLFIVVTFLAMLELSKNQVISIRQNDNFEDIEIQPYEDIIETKLLEEVLLPLHIVGSEGADESEPDSMTQGEPDHAAVNPTSADATAEIEDLGEASETGADTNDE